MSVTLNYVNIILNLGISLSPFPHLRDLIRVENESMEKKTEKHLKPRYKARRKRTSGNGDIETTRK